MSVLDLGPECKVVAFVHAKGHSERMPGKNFAMLGGKPLICHAIKNAFAAPLVDAVVIDSDSDVILDIGEKSGALRLKRPAELAQNDATGDDLAGWQADNVPNAEVIAQVVPTSPFLFPATINAAIRAVLFGHASSAAVGCGERLYRWEKGKPTYYRDGKIPNSQDLPLTFVETTGMYAVLRKFAAEHRKRLNPDDCCWISASRVEAINIDTQQDFTFAETVWRGMHP